MSELMGQTQQMQIETTEIIHAFNYGVNADEHMVYLDLILLKTHKRIQLPFDRLSWASFMKGLNTANERFQSMREVTAENGNADAA